MKQWEEKRLEKHKEKVDEGGSEKSYEKKNKDVRESIQE